MKSICFIDTIDNLDTFDFKEIIKSYKIYSFNIISHNFLKEKKISHSIAESYLSNEDHKKIFLKTTELWNWYENLPMDNNTFLDELNILGLLDTMELHQFLIDQVFYFLNINRILEKDKPEKIICSKHFSEIIKLLDIDNQIRIEIINENEQDFYFAWDEIKIPLKFGKKIFSIGISKKTYNFLKESLDKIFGSLYQLNFLINNQKKSILFLEFNPNQYTKLIEHLKLFDGNILFFNNRRSAIYNYDAIKILKNNNAKIITKKMLLSKYDKQEIDKKSKIYLKNIEILFSQDSIFENLFQIDDKTFWSIIKKIFFQTYKKRIKEYLSLYYSSQNLFKKINISCIISLNIFGETEKSILKLKPQKTNSILLEHAATNYSPQIKEYDVANMYSLFKDKIAIWGNIQKKYLVNERNISEDKIFLTGSPRHEFFFNNSKNVLKIPVKNILILPQPIPNFNGLSDTRRFLRFETLFQKIFLILQKYPDLKIIVKMHPTIDPGNLYLKNFIQKNYPHVKIFQNESIFEILKISHTVLNINSEFFPSTAIYEALILQKPTMNIRMMDEIHDIDLFKDEAVLNISDNDNLEDSIYKIIFDQNFRKKLTSNSNYHLDKYFINQTNSSEKLAKLLKSF